MVVSGRWGRDFLLLLAPLVFACLGAIFKEILNVMLLLPYLLE